MWKALSVPLMLIKYLIRERSGAMHQLDFDFLQVFEKCGNIRTVTIAKKKDMKNKGELFSLVFSILTAGVETHIFKHCQTSIISKWDMFSGQMLSMGYGFVEYKKKDSAQQALKQLQHSKLDGHQLELKVSNRATVWVKGFWRVHESSVFPINDTGVPALFGF